MIPFNIPYYSGNEKKLIGKAMQTKTLTGDLELMRSCEHFLESKYGFKKAFLTNSCTQALEMAAVLIGIEPGDEVILPSFTYVSTGNAFALQGAKLVFVDSRNDHPNMDEAAIEKLITPKTRAIVVMHYGGVSCDMKAIQAIAKKHDLFIIEDAAQCINSYNGEIALGTIGDIGCFSFHETKNIHSGEGGFMAINDPALIKRAEILRNKGTNRSAFTRGEVVKYEWVDLGFSSIPSAITAAFLSAQLQDIEKVQKKRIKLWKAYLKKLKGLSKTNNVQLPSLPKYAFNNAHIFYLVCKSEEERNKLIAHLKKNDIQAVFHYQSLHASPFYRSKYTGEMLPNSDRYSNCLVRLPMYFALSMKELDHVCSKVLEFYSH